MSVFILRSYVCPRSILCTHIIQCLAVSSISRSSMVRRCCKWKLSLHSTAWHIICGTRKSVEQCDLLSTSCAITYSTLDHLTYDPIRSRVDVQSRIDEEYSIAELKTWKLIPRCVEIKPQQMPSQTSNSVDGFVGWMEGRMNGWRNKVSHKADRSRGHVRTKLLHAIKISRIIADICFETGGCLFLMQIMEWRGDQESALSTCWGYNQAQRIYNEVSDVGTQHAINGVWSVRKGCYTTLLWKCSYPQSQDPCMWMERKPGGGIHPKYVLSLCGIPRGLPSIKRIPYPK